MILGSRGSRWRCLLVWASGTSVLGAVVLLLRGPVLEPWSGSGPVADLPLDRALVDVACAALLVCTLWAWVALSVTVAEGWRGSATCGPWRLPPGVRRLVLAGCGVAMATGMASPALAASDARQGGATTSVVVVAGLPVPARAVSVPVPHPSRVHPHDRRVVVVRPGDSLWVIAERELPPGAPDSLVAARWHALYAANREVIGPDPDVLWPGQRLVLPERGR